MSPEQQKAIQNHPKFQELIRKRGRLTFWLSGSVLAAFGIFLATFVLAPEVIARPVADGFLTTVGLAFGMVLILGIFTGTAVYVRRSNTEFEALIRDITEDLG